MKSYTDDYVLTVIGGDPKRKNLARAIAAVKSVRQRGWRNLKLVVAGDIPAETVLRIAEREVGGGDHDEWLSTRTRVRDSELATLYYGARVVLFPSLGEGFGFPIVEGMSFGTPVVTSNLTACPEVAGGAAQIVDPRSIDAIVDGLQLVLGDSRRRDQLRQAALERASAMTWHRTWSQTKSVYHSVLTRT